MKSERALKCLNACAGLSDEQLDAGWTAKDLIEYTKKLEIELLKLLPAPNGAYYPDLYRRPTPSNRKTDMRSRFSLFSKFNDN